LFNAVQRKDTLLCDTMSVNQKTKRVTKRCVAYTVAYWYALN